MDCRPGKNIADPPLADQAWGKVRMKKKFCANLISAYLLSLKARANRVNVWMLLDRNVGYIPVPKVASSSIRNTLRTYAAEACYKDVPVSRSEMKATVDRKIHYSTTTKKLLNHRARPFLFSFVRNPLSRLYSCYRDKVVNAASLRDQCTLSDYGIHFGMTFNQFVARVAELPDDQSDQHFRSQHKFVTYQETLVVDYLGKFENFENDWAYIGSRYGISLPSRTRRVSGPSVAAVELPLDFAVATRALKRYEEDIELLGYQKELELMLAGLKR